MRRVFQLFDKDGNGQISREELLEGLNKLGEAMSEKEMLEIMEAADEDGDGQISF
jgi:calcium-binding protein CML